MKAKLQAFLAKYLLLLILFTCKKRVHGIEKVKDLSQKGPLIIMLWHNRLAPLAETLRPLTSHHQFAAFVSHSRDGQILSHFCKSYPSASVISVPHDNRGQALKSLIQTLKNDSSIVLMTPDGPRGPRYKVKPGILLAAESTGAALLPFSWTSASYWELNTWDKLRIPKPFSTLHITFGDPLHISQDSQNPKKTLEDALNKIS